MNTNLCKRKNILLFSVALLCILLPATIYATNLKEIRQRGVLRHLGIPYASFVQENATGYDGLDVELMQLFAKYLGVKYQLVTTSWSDVFTDLTGNKMMVENGTVKILGTAPVKGDIIANGLTILPDRQKMVDYSTPTFPTGVWLIAGAHAPITPITPTGDLKKDIQQVKTLLSGLTVLTMKNTCLDPKLYNLEETGAVIRYSTSQLLGDIAPEVIDGSVEITLLDIPDALIALQRWPGDIKIIGPISDEQFMGVAVTKNSPELLHEFNTFFKVIWNDGTYKRLVEKYYPSVFLYLSDFFTVQNEDNGS
jgi:ABC-type amino acid transport substrate-binding protein